MVTRGIHLLRYRDADEQQRIGAIDPARPREVIELDAPNVVEAIAAGEFSGPVAVETVDPETLELPAPFELLCPLVAPETWAAGVTYERSRDARVEESRVDVGDVYTLVYEAKRPELFLKDTSARRTVGPGGTIGVRSDSMWTVPEPELALLIGEHSNLLGATIGNDVTARDIEGQNPLYLPQAMLFGGSCALGPAVLVPDDWSVPFAIELRVFDGGGELLFEAATTTAQMRRSLQELIDACCFENPVPPGSVLLTGTGLVPPDELALAPGHLVEVRIPGIGTLRNPVGRAGGWPSSK